MSASMGRWIPVEVSIFTHYLFEGEIYSKRDAFLWLVANAVWKDTRHTIGNHVQDVKTGSLFTTLRKLQDTWGWGSDKRVRDFLALLSSEGVILTNADAGKTLITICNYEQYQRGERSKDVAQTQPERTKAALKIPKTPEYKDSEKERVRLDGSDLEGFEEWYREYPGAIADNKRAALATWRELTSAQRRKVIANTADFLKAREDVGRTIPPSAANFLADGYWDRDFSVVTPISEKPSRGRKIIPKRLNVDVGVHQTPEEYLRQCNERNEKNFKRQESGPGHTKSKYLRDLEKRQAEARATALVSAAE